MLTAVKPVVATGIAMFEKPQSKTTSLSHIRQSEESVVDSGQSRGHHKNCHVLKSQLKTDLKIQRYCF